MQGLQEEQFGADEGFLGKKDYYHCIVENPMTCEKNECELDVPKIPELSYIQIGKIRSRDVILWTSSFSEEFS